MSDLKYKGIYLIQEKGCLNPFSGAFQHISMGVEQLSKHFELSLYLGNTKIDLKNIKSTNSKEKKTTSSVVKNWVYGTSKDLFLLLNNLKTIPSLIRLYKSSKIQFVYERASYLNFSGLIAAKICGISHYYEANGLQFESRKKYYKSYFYLFAKYLEKISYKKSTHTFFVGSYGDFWKISKSNWTNVENGIEIQNILEQKKCESDTKIIDICFVGRFMKHQKLDVLVTGLKEFKNTSSLRVNLIGTGLEDIEQNINNLGINVINHGFVNRNDIIPLLSNFPIAIIGGSPEFQSCMKLFDYGAAGCAVIAPRIHNLELWFADDILFFEGSSIDFALKLDTLIKDFDLINLYGKKLQKKILNHFTWDKIFYSKALIMESKIKL